MKPANQPGSAGRSLKIVRRTLADGSVKEYQYRRKKREQREPDGALRQLFNEYSESPEFKRLAPAWKARKLWLFRLIEDDLQWMTIKNIEDRRARDEFYKLRDKYAHLPDRADKMMQSLSSALEWAYDRGKLSVNHARRIKAVAVRAIPKHYSEEQEEILLARLPEDLKRLYLFALYTGIRRADLCGLKWSNLDKDRWLVLQPHKTLKSTGVHVHLPVFELQPLADVIASLPRISEFMLTTMNGKPWTTYNMSIRWRLKVAAAGITGTWLNEIRHTTATRLVEAGCTEAERGVIMGHSISHGAGASYVARTRQLSINAFRKWAAWMKTGAEIVTLEKTKGAL